MLLKHISAWALSISSYINILPEFSSVKFKLNSVESVDDLLYPSILGKLYLVLHVLTSNNS